VAEQPERQAVNARNVKILAAVVIVLFGVLFALNSGDRDEPPEGSDLLFPELKARLNDINTVTVTDADGTITLRRQSNNEGDNEGASGTGRWIVPEHGGYVANTASLRQLLLALADATKLEQKTSDPERYARLGVGDPREDDGKGVLIAAQGNDAAISVILGNTAQREFRYARIPEQPESWLIDRNPVIPEDSGGWLLSDIVDIDAARIESAAIRHSDGEVIGIRKAAPEDINFAVENIPEGRELSYPSVANAIAGVLGNLTLEDVRTAGETDEEASATAEFRTFDGLDIRVSVYSQNAGNGEATDGEAEEEQHWITLNASGSPVNAQEEQPPEADADADAAAESTGKQPAAEENGNPADEAAAINDRVAGWAYRISTYKADQLTRRWEDILRDENGAS
jgi:hypothetical protein